MKKLLLLAGVFLIILTGCQNSSSDESVPSESLEIRQLEYKIFQLQVLVDEQNAKIELALDANYYDEDGHFITFTKLKTLFMDKYFADESLTWKDNGHNFIVVSEDISADLPKMIAIYQEFLKYERYYLIDETIPFGLEMNGTQSVIWTVPSNEMLYDQDANLQGLLFKYYNKGYFVMTGLNDFPFDVSLLVSEVNLLTEQYSDPVLN